MKVIEWKNQNNIAQIISDVFNDFQITINDRLKTQITSYFNNYFLLEINQFSLNCSETTFTDIFKKSILNNLPNISMVFNQLDWIINKQIFGENYEGNSSVNEGESEIYSVAVGVQGIKDKNINRAKNTSLNYSELISNLNSLMIPVNERITKELYPYLKRFASYV